MPSRFHVRHRFSVDALTSKSGAEAGTFGV